MLLIFLLIGWLLLSTPFCGKQAFTRPSPLTASFFSPPAVRGSMSRVLNQIPLTFPLLIPIRSTISRLSPMVLSNLTWLGSLVLSCPPSHLVRSLRISRSTAQISGLPLFCNLSLTSFLA